MKLEQRISNLEITAALEEPPNDSRAKLLERIEAIGVRLRGGSLEDNRGLSPLERVALAFERGDNTLVREILSHAASRVGR